MKVNVLGTEYTIELKSENEDKWLKDRDGYCDKTSKRIVVKLPDESNELDDYDVYMKSLMRHEIIHAFLFESGLHENWYHFETGHDETTVDWFAVQFPKIMKAFIEAGCLGFPMNIVDAGECIVPMNYMKNFLDEHGRLKGGLIHLNELK